MLMRLSLIERDKASTSILYACVYQWLDSLSDKQKVVGSNPTTSTINYDGVSSNGLRRVSDTH